MTDSNFVIKKGLDIFDGDVSLKGSNKELRFYEGANYVGFEAPALTADKIWVLPNADGSTGQSLKTDGSGNLGWVTAGDVTLTGIQTLTNKTLTDPTIRLASAYSTTPSLSFTGNTNTGITHNGSNAFSFIHGGSIKTTFASTGLKINSSTYKIHADGSDKLNIWGGHDGSAAVRINNNYDLPITDGSANQVIQTNGNGTLSFASGGIASLAADDTPQLGGDLDVNGNKITSASNADITIEPNGTGDVNLFTDTVIVGDSNENFQIQHRTTTASILQFQSGGNTRLNSDGNIYLNSNQGGNGTLIRLNGNTITAGVPNGNVTMTTQGTGDLTLDTNNGTNSGSIVIADGANSDISITPNGTGQVNLGNFQFDVDQTVGLNQDNYVLTYDHANTQIALEAASGAPTTAQVLSALNADWGGDKTFGTQADDTATFTGSVVVGDGTVPIGQGQLTVVQTNDDENAHTLLLMDNEDDANRGPVLTMYRNTASPVAGDRLGSIRFNGEDAAEAARDYAKIEGTSVSVGNGSHSGSLVFSTTIGASITDIITMDGTTGGAYGGIVYTETGIKTLSNSVSATSTANNNYITLLEVPHATFKAVKASIHITDSSSNEVQTQETIAHYDGSNANYSNYGIIFDGAAAIGAIEVDINSNNIRIRFKNTQGATRDIAGSIHAVCHP